MNGAADSQQLTVVCTKGRKQMRTWQAPGCGTKVVWHLVQLQPLQAELLA
jgi:hypothetical protein